MSKINLTAEILEKHTDPEIIEYLARVCTGMVKNYDIALKTGKPEVLWGNYGDLMQVTDVLRAMKTREDSRLARQNETL